MRSPGAPVSTANPLRVGQLEVPVAHTVIEATGALNLVTENGNALFATAPVALPLRWIARWSSDAGLSSDIES